MLTVVWVPVVLSVDDTAVEPSRRVHIRVYPRPQHRSVREERPSPSSSRNHHFRSTSNGPVANGVRRRSVPSRQRQTLPNSNEPATSAWRSTGTHRQRHAEAPSPSRAVPAPRIRPGRNTISRLAVAPSTVASAVKLLRRTWSMIKRKGRVIMRKVRVLRRRQARLKNKYATVPSGGTNGTREPTRDAWVHHSNPFRDGVPHPVRVLLSTISSDAANVDALVMRDALRSSFAFRNINVAAEFAQISSASSLLPYAVQPETKRNAWFLLIETLVQGGHG